MPLTPEELAELDKHLAKMEASASRSKGMWWCSVGFVLFCEVMVVWMLHLAATEQFPGFEDYTSNRAVTRFDLLMQRQVSANICQAHMLATVFALVGALTAGVSLGAWARNRHRRDLLIVRLARSYVNERYGKGVSQELTPRDNP